jgi:hypothetical protein
MTVVVSGAADACRLGWLRRPGCVETSAVSMLGAVVELPITDIMYTYKSIP